jgi:hypothetical protein
VLGRTAPRAIAASAALVALVWTLAVLAAREGPPRFMPDDPLWQDPDTRVDASRARPQELSQYYDFLENTFRSPGDRRAIPSVNVNTLDEVPDSSWFTNRIGRTPMTDEEIVRGPDRVDRLRFERWTIVRDKGTGAQPGFRAVSPDDQTKHLYQIEVDPRDNPELATGAETIGTAFYHALGYHVVEVYLVEIDPAKLDIADDATIKDRAGRRRRFEQQDLRDLLENAARLPNGRYRALASRFAEGRPMGQFLYYGTRPDDPNDVHPHEHRRELRGNRVFCAWLNHDDSRANNTLDMLVGRKGAQYIKHYMFDFGSILGSGTTAEDDARAGRAYLIDGRVGWLTLLTFGLWSPDWTRRHLEAVPPSVGRFDSVGFDPVAWKPEYPNTSFDNLQPEDAFWGARRVAAFSDDTIRRVVEKGRYSDPKASEYITRTLIERRNLIARRWLVGVTPIVNPALSDEGELTFENAAVTAGVATPAASYTVDWSTYDNESGRLTPVGARETMTEPRVQAPAAILNAPAYVCATIGIVHPDYPRWAEPVQLYFIRDGVRWKPVGLVRTRSTTAESSDAKP